ncbi:MAG: hypothetical protein JWN78_2480 [Bacteroidota bacterium]|nr:hypothetical protein [Bacteroidota bacterium]
MNDFEYYESGCMNKHCAFTFTNGRTENGIISTFFPGNSNTYYFVPTANLVVFAQFQKASNYNEMKKLCVLIDLSELKNATKIE